MENSNSLNPITVEAFVGAPLLQVWNCFTAPQHIVGWCRASPDWHAPLAENDLRVGGSFKTRMEARDGSMGFDFEGVYTLLEAYHQIEYIIGDGRTVSIHFEEKENGVLVREIFIPENENPLEMQQGGWQAILDSFKRYTETNQ